MIKKNLVPKYLKTIIKYYPKITSGRKNYADHHNRIIKIIKIIKKYKKKLNKSL